MSENQFEHTDSPNVSLLDEGLENKFLASQLVSEVRKSPGHYSFTMTDRGMLEFAKAMQLAAMEENASMKHDTSTALFPDSDNSLITKKEVMQGFNISHTTLWKWEKIGYLIPIKVGKRVYYRRSDIEKLTK